MEDCRKKRTPLGSTEMNPDELAGLKEVLTHKFTGGSIVKSVLDAVNTGVIILDQHENICLINSRASQLLNIHQEGPVPTRLSSIFMDDDRKILLPNIIKMARQQGEFQGEVMLKRRPQAAFLAFFSMNYYVQDQIGLFVVTITDISRLKDVERLLRKSERMVYLGRMLDDISHQIRNPVLAIGGFSRRLLKTRLEKPEYVRIIMDESKRLEMLLDVLTEFIQLPKPRFSIKTCSDIRQLITRSGNNIAEQFDAELNVIDNIEEQDAPVVTDTMLLCQAIEHVITNACESFLDSPRKPVITLEFHAPLSPQGGMTIRVSDLGPGIRPPIISRIFHPFFSTKTGHLGMGLTFSRRILEELQGEIDAESGLNQGTTITIKLPGDRRRRIRTEPLPA